MIPDLLTISAAARALSMDRRTLTDRLEAVPPDGRVGHYPAWKLSTVLAAIRRHAEASPEQLDAERERAGLLRAQRLKTEFENEVARGEYVRVAEVEATDAVIFTALRDRIRAVASIAPLLVQASLQGGELAVKRALAEALDAALEDVAATEVVGSVLV